MKADAMRDKITLQVGIPVAAIQMAMGRRKKEKSYKATMRERIANRKCGNAGYVRVPAEEMDQLIHLVLRYKAQVDQMMDSKYGKD
jgi:hypothetical protein